VAPHSKATPVTTTAKGITGTANRRRFTPQLPDSELNVCIARFPRGQLSFLLCA
jgi:hypothetical protein